MIERTEWLALTVVALMFLGLAIAERRAPFRTPALPRAARWRTNLAIFAIDTLLVRLSVPLLMIGTALAAREAGFGLFNVVDSPAWWAVMMSFLALDLALWAQHFATHRVPLLWRLHKVHHADPELDVTTAARFHPLEMLASMGYKMGVVALLGAPPLAVVLFELGYLLGALFGHANVRLPTALDTMLRRGLVTPDMHRIHHSVHHRETDSNYGTLLSIWDRLFGTYTREPGEGREAITLGLIEFQDARPARLGWSLALPFARTRKRPPPDMRNGGLS